MMMLMVVRVVVARLGFPPAGDGVMIVLTKRVALHPITRTIAVVLFLPDRGPMLEFLDDVP